MNNSAQPVSLLDPGLSTYLKWNAYRSERHRLLYVATPKVACTSLKWWFAELEGVARQIAQAADSGETTPDLVIHDTFHKVAPTVAGLDIEALAEAVASERYFRFAVVRNPYKRLFSAWQSKLLLREPLQAAQYEHCAFQNGPIESLADVALAFEQFLEYLSAVEAPAFRDPHWTPQADLLRPDIIGYSKVSQIERPDELRDALARRLGSAASNPFVRGRLNESLIPYQEALITARSQALIRRLYEKDFEVFKYSAELPASREAFSEEHFALARTAIRLISGRNQRFGEIRRASHETRLAAAAQTVENEQLRVQLESYRAQVAALQAEGSVRAELECERAQATAAEIEQLRAQLESSRERVAAMQAEMSVRAELERERANEHAALGAIVDGLRTVVHANEVSAAALGQDVSSACEALRASRRQLAARSSEQNEVQQRSLEQMRAGIEQTMLTVGERLATLLRERTDEARKWHGAYGLARERVELATQALFRMSRLSSELRSASAHSFLHRVKRRGGAPTADVVAVMEEYVDNEFYRALYPDVAAAGMRPSDHYAMAGRGEGRFPNPAALLRGLGHLDIGALALPDLAPEAPLFEVRSEGDGGDHFDADFYLKCYPDVAAAQADPYQHYVAHGRAEGRLGRLPRLLPTAGSVSFRDNLPTVLIVNHEGSRTGAPIVGYNLAKHLMPSHNVITLFLGPGPMIDACRMLGSATIDASVQRYAPQIVDLLIAEVCAFRDIDYAIVNSIESRAVLKPLVQRNVPTVSLIHEFASYTRPAHAFREAVFWSTRTVFSSSLTLRNAVAANPDFERARFDVVPQGMCELPPDTSPATMPKGKAKRIERRPSEFVIIGAGVVQLRKGIDLFIDCAARIVQRAPELQCRFVWIGKGFDPEADAAYSVYLADQIERAGLDDRLSFMGEVTDLLTVFEQADLFMLTSRLDPLPNVAIDALTVGLPVMCFEETTGIAEILEANGLGDSCVAGYLDTADMADKCIALMRGDAALESASRLSRETAARVFDMHQYVDNLQKIAAAAEATEKQGQRDARDIAASRLLKPEFCVLPHDQALGNEEMAQQYVRAWKSGVDRRKPFAGFHPGMYLEQHGVGRDGADPLADYIRKGRPEGPWQFQTIGADDARIPVPATTRVALHIHAYSPDLLPEILERLQRNRLAPHLAITVPGEAERSVAQRILSRYATGTSTVIVVPNRGRDIGPFITALGEELFNSYDIVGHVHTKKSKDIKDESFGRTWYAFLLDNLIGNESTPMADTIVGRMAAQDSLGIVFPDDPYVSGWERNREYACDLVKKSHWGTAEDKERFIAKFSEHFAYPVGTMFWARAESLRPLLELGLDWEDYPPEPLPYDGSMLHALERLVPLFVQWGGREVALSWLPGTTR